jgi:hypothetical protein
MITAKVPAPVTASTGVAACTPTVIVAGARTSFIGQQD